MGRASDILWGIIWGVLTIILFLGLGLVLILTLMAISIIFIELSGSNVKTAIILLLMLAALTVATILAGKRFKKIMRDAKNDSDMMIIAAISIGLILMCFLTIYHYWDPNTVDRELVPQPCVASVGFSCLDEKPTINKSSNTISISITSNLDHDAHFNNMTAEFTGSLHECDPVVEICDVGKDMTDPSCSGMNNFFYNLPKAGNATIYVTDCDMDRYKVHLGDITLNYTDAKNLLPETMTVHIVGKTPRDYSSLKLWQKIAITISTYLSR